MYGLRNFSTIFNMASFSLTEHIYVDNLTIRRLMFTVCSVQLCRCEFAASPSAPECVTLKTASTFSEPAVRQSHSTLWCIWTQAQTGSLLSVLKGDDRVHFVDVVWAVPEDSSEVVCVGRVVHLYLVAESSVLGERVYLPFIINDLDGTRRCEHVDERELCDVTILKLISQSAFCFWQLRL